MVRSPKQLVKIAFIPAAVVLLGACAQKTVTSSMMDSKSPMTFFLTSKPRYSGTAMCSSASPWFTTGM